MANATEKTVELEEIFIPRGAANEDPNFFVGINGVNYLLPKGKTAKVPRAVAAEIKRSIKAQEKMDDHIDELKKLAEQLQK